MKIKYEDLIVKNRVILKKGRFFLPDTGVFLLKGDNGTGKTMLLNYLHLETDSSTVLVSQFDEIILDLSILENISMSTDKEEHIAVKRFLCENGLEHILKLNPATVSGGERRLICFLRGIFSGAEIILLDEPTNDLDYLVTEKIIKIIEQFSKTRFFLIATHDNRFDKIETGTLSIKCGEVCCVLEQDSISSPTVSLNVSRKPIKNNVEIAKKMWKNRLVFTLLSIVLCILSNFLILTATPPDVDVNEDIPAKQINVFLSVSQTGGFWVNRGAISLELAKKLGNNLWRNSELPTYERGNYNKADYYNLLMEDSENYTVYPLEFYIPEERQYVYTLDEYLENKKIEKSGGIYVKLPKEIYIPNYSLNGTSIAFNYEDFEEAVQDIRKKYSNAHPTYYTVVLNSDYAYDRFLNDMIKENSSPHIYICSGETVELSKQLSEIITYKAAFQSMLIYSALFLLVELLFLLLYFKVRSRNIRTMINYGFDIPTIKRILVQKNDKLFLRLFFLLALFISTYYMVLRSGDFIAAKYLPAVAVALYIYMGYLLEKFVFNVSFRYVSSWKYRS